MLDRLNYRKYINVCYVNVWINLIDNTRMRVVLGMYSDLWYSLLPNPCADNLRYDNKCTKYTVQCYNLDLVQTCVSTYLWCGINLCTPRHHEHKRWLGYIDWMEGSLVGDTASPVWQRTCRQGQADCQFHQQLSIPFIGCHRGLQQRWWKLISKSDRSMFWGRWIKDEWKILKQIWALLSVVTRASVLVSPNGIFAFEKFIQLGIHWQL